MGARRSASNHRQLQPHLPRAVLRVLIPRVRMPHDAGARIVPKHARDALVGFGGVIANDPLRHRSGRQDERAACLLDRCIFLPQLGWPTVQKRQYKLKGVELTYQVPARADGSIGFLCGARGSGAQARVRFAASRARRLRQDVALPQRNCHLPRSLRRRAGHDNHRERGSPLAVVRCSER
jgi:hypothetical protein